LAEPWAALWTVATREARVTTPVLLRARQWWVLGLAVVALLLSRPVLADTFLVVPNGGSITSVSHRVLLTKQGGTLSIVDDSTVISAAPSAILVRAFPAQPKMANTEPEMFDTLEAATHVYEPYNQVIRRNLFGPSVVTILTKKLIEQPVQVPPPSDDRPELRKLNVFDMRFFTGQVQTSTITRQLELPPELDGYLRGRGIQIDEPLRNAFAAQLNRGWVIMTAAVEDKAPSHDAPARIGPFRFDVESTAFTYPIMDVYAAGRRSDQSFDFYTLAPYPMAASFNETLWNTRPWEVSDEGPAPLEAIYSHPISLDGPLAFELGEKRGLPLPETAHLVRVRYRPPVADPWRDLDFQQSRETIRIPGDTTRGNGLDLFLCILLGLTPLIYTPESWFLIWLVNAAKERARKEGSAFGLNLWAYFAIAVALFWVVTLEGPGRVAGLVPFLLGIGRLAWPYTERETPRVRSMFRKKQKKA
jgi:hypothetical protein